MVGEDGECLSRSRTFTDSALHQPYPLGICLVSVFGIFITELVAFRWGTAKLASIGVSHDPHGHGVPHSPSHAAHGPEPTSRSVLSPHGAFDDDAAAAAGMGDVGIGYAAMGMNSLGLGVMVPGEGQQPPMASLAPPA